MEPEAASTPAFETATNQSNQAAVVGLKSMLELVDNVKSTAVEATMMGVTTKTVAVMLVAMVEAEVKKSVIAAAMGADVSELGSDDMAVSAVVASSAAAGSSGGEDKGDNDSDSYSA